MNKNQLIVASGLVVYIVGGLLRVTLNLETFIGILRFHPNLLMPIIRTYSIILIVGIILIYFLRNKRMFEGNVRCSECNKKLLINNSKLFLRKYWCREHYLEAVKSMSSKDDSKNRLKINIKHYMALMNKKQIVVILMGIYVMLPLVFLMSVTIGQILKWNNRDYLSRVYKAFPQFTVKQIDNAVSNKKSRLRKDIFLLTAGLIVVGGVTGSLCYRYKKDKSKPKNVDN